MPEYQNDLDKARALVEHAVAALADAATLLRNANYDDDVTDAAVELEAKACILVLLGHKSVLQNEGRFSVH